MCSENAKITHFLFWLHGGTFSDRLALWQQQLTGNRDTTAAHHSQYQPDASYSEKTRDFPNTLEEPLRIWPAKTRLVGGFNPFEIGIFPK